MLWSIFLRILAGIAGLYISVNLAHVASFDGLPFILPKNEALLRDFFHTLVFVGAFLGILNAVLKPLLNLISFPLKIITLNLFSLVIAMAMVWITKIIFPELQIQGLVNLFWTTLIILATDFILMKLLSPKKNKQ
jgi:uncharacterized membrane protein YvlD (DUF360 family)